MDSGLTSCHAEKALALFSPFSSLSFLPLLPGSLQLFTPLLLPLQATYQDFFGGLLSVTPGQFEAVNGFGTQVRQLSSQCR